MRRLIRNSKPPVSMKVDHDLYEYAEYIRKIYAKKNIKLSQPQISKIILNKLKKKGKKNEIFKI